MHIEDGILSPAACAIWYGATAAFVAPGIIEIRHRAQKMLAYRPFLAMVGVAVFVISAMHLPVPVNGSCSHPCGTTLAAIVVGPFATTVISTIVLFFQAIFLGHGGITTIGANTFSMGICGGLSGYLVWRLLVAIRVPVWLAAGIAGLIGDLVTYIAAALELALGVQSNLPFLHRWLIFFSGYAPTQIPLAIAEGAFTSAVLMAMLRRRPDLLPQIASHNADEEQG